MTCEHIQTLRLFAAGSLRASLSDVAATFEASNTHTKIDIVLGASGLLRERIEGGEIASIFASADMRHPQILAQAGKVKTPIRMFARNRLCAIARCDLEVSSDTLLEKMLADDVRLGTSTPKADPAGDYADELFKKAGSLKPGSLAKLTTKALRLSGGPTTKKSPKGVNQYAWLMSENKADIFLTYCTNAILAQKEMPSLQKIEIPAQLSVSAEYGLVVLKDAPAAAAELADFILSPDAQGILKSYGFETGDDALE